MPLLTDWPLSEPRHWVEIVNQAQTEAEVKQFRRFLGRCHCNSSKNSDNFTPVVRVRIRWEASRAGCWPSRGEKSENLGRLSLANDKPDSADGWWPCATWNAVPPRNPNLCSQSIRSTISVLVYTPILQYQGAVRKNSAIAPPKTETTLFLGVLPEIFFYTQNCSSVVSFHL